MLKTIKSAILIVIVTCGPAFSEISVPQQAIPGGYLEEKHVEKGEPPEPSAEDIGRGYYIFVRDNMEGVYPNSVPVSGEISNSLKLAATPGEYECSSFSILAITDLTDIDVLPEDLLGPDGKRIGKNNIEIRPVICWVQKTGEYEEKKAGVIPELLDRFPADVNRGTSKQFWVTIKVPESASAGTYKGAVTIRNSGRDSRVEIEMEVLPFLLLKPPSMYWGVFSDFIIDNEQLKDLKDHGLDTVCGGHLWAHAPPRPILDSPIPNHPTLSGGKLDIDSLQTGARNSFEAYKKAGLRGQYIVALGWVSVGIANTFGVPALKENPMWPSEYTDDVKEVYGDFIETIVQEAQDARVELYFWPVDEPGTHPYLQKVAMNEYPFLKEMRAKTFLTCDIDFTRKISKWIDARCYHSHYLLRDEATYEMLRDETKKANAELWTYTGLGGTPSFYAARYRAGLLNWKIKPKTLMIFAYNSSRGDPYNDFDGPEPDYCLVYPPRNGSSPVPTIQWEGVREGIDDARYIYTLTEYIRMFKACGVADLVKAAEQAERDLQDILESVKLIDDYHTFGKYNFDYRNFDNYKRKIAGLIIKLKSMMTDKKIVF